jgi:LacI family transcriptional regulator
MEAVKVEGVIYVAAHCRMLKKVPKLVTKINNNVVYTYAYADSRDNRSIIIDDESGAKDMMDYIISKGHKNIGIIAGTADNFHTIARIKGCQQALFNAGMLFNPDHLLYGEWDMQSGYDQAKKLLKNGEITALWCMNDRMASGAYGAARELGLEIGKDISIAGFDNHELSRSLYPQLTTFELPLYTIGYCAAQALVEELTNEEEEKKDNQPMKCKGRMIIRDSVADLTK